MAWIEAVDDRTQADVDYARYIIEMLKGVFNVTDLNRVEGNIQYLSDELNKLGYNNSVTTRTWEVNDLPREEDIARIIGNVKALIFAYFKSGEAPELPDELLYFEQVNALEKNLRLIKEMIDNYYLTLPKVGAITLGVYPLGNKQILHKKGAI